MKPQKTIAQAVLSLFDPRRPENRVIVGRCPIWVLELAARRLEETNLPQQVKCGKRLAQLLENGADSAIKAFAQRNVRLIEREVPCGWDGAILAQVENT